MSIWLALWILLSVSLLYFLGWTLYILYTQKRAWQAYAKKHKLRYKAQRMTAPPEISGEVDGHTVSLFTGEHQAPDMRGSRKLTAVEVQLRSKMPIGGGVASGGMVDIIQQMGFGEEIRPKDKDWDKSYIAVSENSAVLGAYLTDERVSALIKLMKMKNAWVILIFTKDAALLRFDAPDPMAKVETLEEVVKRMVDAAKILELSDGESARLKSEEVKRPQKQVALDVQEDGLETGLQLEDDGAEEVEGVDVDEGDQDEEKPSTENS